MHRVPGTGHHVHAQAWATPGVLGDVVVGDESRIAAADQGRRGGDRRDVVPERGEVAHGADGVVAPGPAAVGQRLTVEQGLAAGKKINKDDGVQRYKGLGEMNARARPSLSMAG